MKRFLHVRQFIIFQTVTGFIARLSPLMHGHINMLGHYTFTLPEDILKGEMRALNFNLNNELSP